MSQQVERFSLFGDLLENGTVEKKSVSVDFSGLLQRIDFTPFLPSLKSVSEFKIRTFQQTESLHCRRQNGATKTAAGGNKV